MKNKDLKVIYIPGNGDDCPDENWRPVVMYELSKLGLGTINLRWPDPELARAKYWLPYLEQLGTDENTILLGVSSGAVAAMRYTETHQVLGTVLVGVCETDLDDETEKLSGYYNDPWNWEAIKDNNQWILQFGSTDDPYIPLAETHSVRDHLDTEYIEMDNVGHFDARVGDFPGLVEAIKNKVV